MKPTAMISAAILFSLLATTAPAFAQHEKDGKESGKPQGGEHQKAPPAQQHAPAAQEHRQAPPQQHQQQPAAHKAAPRPANSQQTYGGAYHGGVRANGPEHGGVHHSGVPQHQGQVRSGFVQSRARSWSSDHRSWAQRGGYNGYRIPEERFRLYFGHDHFFRINGLPMVFVGGYPRFQYDGYWMTFADPWPENWPDNWYETDDVYLDYTEDGYYLYDRNRPGIGIAVTVAF